MRINTLCQRMQVVVFGCCLVTSNSCYGNRCETVNGHLTNITINKREDVCHPASAVSSKLVDDE